MENLFKHKIFFTQQKEDCDGDMKEEKRKIEDPDERQEKYEELLDAVEYNEYYAYNTHLKSESYLIELRMSLEEHMHEDTNQFIYHILRHTNMTNTGSDSAENILIANDRNKFTFLNFVNKYITTEDIEKGKEKMRREYDSEWTDEDENSYTIVEFVCLRTNF